MKKLILISLIALALAGCQTTQRTVPVITFQKIEVPSQFFDCAEKKALIPDSKNLTNKQVAKYILKMNEILDECQGDISSIDKIIKEYNVEIDKINERLTNAKNK